MIQAALHFARHETARMSKSARKHGMSLPPKRESVFARQGINFREILIHDTGIWGVVIFECL